MGLTVPSLYSMGLSGVSPILRSTLSHLSMNSAVMGGGLIRNNKRRVRCREHREKTKSRFKPHPRSEFPPGPGVGLNPCSGPLVGLSWVSWVQ